MTNQQNLLIRKFYTEVAQDTSLFPGDPVGHRQLIAQCLRLLGYALVDGKYVSIDLVKKSKATYGSPEKYECQWEKDTRAIEKEVSDEADNIKSAAKADSSEPSAYTEIRQAVLREDV